MSRDHAMLAFVKASACGNDFLLIDHALAPPDIHEFTRRICDRHEGVGADGVEWMLPHATADVEVWLINADGSEAEISGNGTRCVAAYVCEEQGKETIRIQTGAGLKVCTLTTRRDSAYEFEAAMGAGAVSPEAEITTSFGRVHGIPVVMGNPHYVMFVPQFPDNWQERARAVQRDSAFPQGVNVEWVVMETEHDLNARFYERGAGETQSSGTGSCACALAAIATGKAQSPVKVHTPGGTQTVRWENDQVFLRGSAMLVCRGDFFLGG